MYHVPKIAGQQPAYIVNALKAYKSGERSHPSMRGIAATLTEDDMKKLADHYGGAKWKSAPRCHRLRLVEVVNGGKCWKRARRRRSRSALRATARRATSPLDPTQPILAGQYYDYLVRALTDYKIGRRNNPIMKGFASQLSKKDIEDLAAWFSRQKSNLHDQRE